MIEIGFGLLSIVFAYYSINLKNEYMKNFMFLMSLLMVFLTVSTPQLINKISNCIETQEFPEYNMVVCVKNVEKYEIAGGNAMMYGFGLIMLVFFVIVLMNLIIRAVKIIE